MHDTSYDAVPGDASEHVSEARMRARQVLASESHLGAVDDWRRVFIGARDALILVWLIWVGLYGLGGQTPAGHMLVCMAIAFAVLIGISTARSTHAQVEYYAAELDRERGEIHDHFEQEQEEVRVLYAAKGFVEPLLSQVVDTLCADEDRLLKVMMEEELGLSIHHVEHPLVVGLWNFGSCLAAGLALAVPVLWLPAESARLWMLVGGTGLLGVVSFLSARSTGRSPMEFFTVGALMAVTTGGVVYFLAQWLSLPAQGISP